MRVKPIAPLLLAMLIGGRLCFSESAISAKYRLHRDLFNETKHQPRFLPVEKPTDVLNVTFSFDLIKIVSVDAKQQFIAVYGFIYQSWVNPLLKWNKTNYGGVDVIYMSPRDLWVPDTHLYYNIEEQDPVTGQCASQKSHVAVHYNGTNVWRNHGLFKSICKVEVEYFPLDSQNCTLMFGSWTMDSTKLNYLPRRGMRFPTENHIENGEWSIINVSIGRREVKSQRFDSSFVAITLTIHMRREYLDYFITLIIPCCLISSMIFLGFVLPPESGERVGLSITVLLAMTVFQQLTSELMPSYGMPLLGQYYFCIILEIGASIVITTVILNFYHRKDREMPAWLKTITLEWLAPLVFLKKDTHSYRAVAKKMSRRSKKKQAKHAGRMHYGSRYQRSIKNTANDTGEDEGTHVTQGFLFNDPDAMNSDIQDVDHGSTFRMNYSLQFSNVHAREHSGRENDEENQAHDDQAEPSDNEMMMRHWQWTLAARTLDRIFLVIAICCGIITVCAVFLQAPDVWEGAKALSKDKPKLIFTD